MTADRSRALGAALWLVLSTACGTETRPATQVIVRVDSDLEPRSELRQVRVEVFDWAGEKRASHASVRIVEGNAGEGEAVLPLSFAVVKREQDRFQLVVSGYAADAGTAEVVQRSRVRFEEGKALLLDVFLARKCSESKEECSETRSCNGETGECERIPVRDDLEEVRDPRSFDAAAGTSDGGAGDGAPGDRPDASSTDGAADASDAGGEADGASEASTDAAVDAGSEGSVEDAGGADASADAGPADAGMDGSDVDAGDDPCGVGARCLPQPEGWFGPAVIAETEDVATSPPACPAAYPVDAFELRHGLTAPPAECGCSCDVPEGMVCPDSGTLTGYDDASCSPEATETSLTMPTGSCTNISSVTSSDYVRASATVVDQGQCAPQPSVTLPELGWAGRARACEVETPQSCGETGVCAPAPPDSFGDENLCVWAPGERSCPGGYPKRSLYHGSYQDERGCSACTCGDAQDGTCAPNVQLRELCLLGLLGSVGSGCAPTPALAASGTMTISAHPGSCPPATVAPTGSVSPGDTVTVCCR